MAQHRTMTIQYIDGEAQGLRLCSCVGSLITTVYMPRGYLSRAKQLGLPTRGVYYLFRVDGRGITKAYVGQTTQGVNRLHDHEQKKKWWDRAVLFLSDDFNNFTTDTVNGLEKYAIEKALSKAPTVYENKIVPKYPIMPFQRPFIESLYHEIEFMMSALGLAIDNAGTSITAQSPASQPINNQPQAQTNNLQLTIGQSGTPVTMTMRGITATGLYSGGKKGKLTLVKGSNVDLSATAKPKNQKNSQLRAQLIAQGHLVDQGNGTGVLMKNLTFDSPTGAAEFVFFGSINGRASWKDSNGKSIKDIWG